VSVTNVQLSGLLQASDLDAQIIGSLTRVCGSIEAESVDTPNHANRIKWAAGQYRSATPANYRGVVYNAFPAETLPAGLTITDEQMDAAILARVDLFADGS